MASDKDRLREDLTCAICCDLFRDPVMLPCVHHFCRSCISRYWRGAVGCVSCPQCRAEFTSKQFHTNYLVTAMVEKVRASSSDGYIQNIEKQLKESLESHLLKKEEIFNVIHRDMEKMDTIKGWEPSFRLVSRGEFWLCSSFLQQEEACVLEQMRRGAAGGPRINCSATLEPAGCREGAGSRTSECFSSLHGQQKHCTDRGVDAAPELDMNAFSVKYMRQYIHHMRKMFKSLKPGTKWWRGGLTKGPGAVQPSPKRFPAVPSTVLAGRVASSRGRHYWRLGGGRQATMGPGVASVGWNVRPRSTRPRERTDWTPELGCNGREYSAGTLPWTRLGVHSLPNDRRLPRLDERRFRFYTG
ncbi:Nuclear factor 7, brain [Merluccius polli]|uniref:Nuclear factor 7, brain n=1 Tax=Merluccius polli TaxID=89951 RepID=A0AA47NRP1_MERPO|nr:Nuclear factor 7, brain [Merluccius polli]